MTCSELMTPTGPFIARLYTISGSSLYTIADPITFVQNTAEQSSDEEEELQQLQAIEQKLLTHDPTFTVEDTHAYISTKRSALISAFKPVYDEGDPAGTENVNYNFSWLLRWDRKNEDPPQY